MINTLEITKEIKQVTFKYTAQNYEFNGSCNVTSVKEVTDINTQVSVKTGNMSTTIGNCSSNGSTNVNIYDAQYKDKIDEVAHYFKQLQADLDEEYSIVIFNDNI